MKFKDPQVAAKYKAAPLSENQVVHIPGTDKGDGWKGEIQDIPIAAADKLFAQQSNLLTLITPDATPPAVQAQAGTSDSEEGQKEGLTD